MEIRIAGIVEESIVDGPGIRFAVFTQGCFHNCPGCHNQHTHDPNGGEIADTGDIARRIVENPLLSGVTFSGGEPFLQAAALADLADRIPDGMDIVCYTGYTWEQLLENESARPLLERIDVLMDGPFVKDLRSEELLFRGSSNQRAIDVKRSLKEGRVVIAWPARPQDERPSFSPV